MKRGLKNKHKKEERMWDRMWERVIEYERNRQRHYFISDGRGTLAGKIVSTDSPEVRLVPRDTNNE